jgi:hypothetical protein
MGKQRELAAYDLAALLGAVEQAQGSLPDTCARPAAKERASADSVSRKP